MDIRGSGNQIVNVYSDGTGEAYARYSYSNNSVDYGLLYCGAGSDHTFITSRSGDPLVFNMTTTERMRLTNAGYLAIGRTDPSYKLDVYNSGSARLARFQTGGDVSIMIESTSGGNDYDDCGLVWHGHASAPYWHMGNTDDESWLCIGYQSNSTGSFGLSLIHI